MFARIMAVVLAIILLTTVCLSAVWWLTLRNQRIDARLDYLNSQAEEIAYLAGNLSGDNLMDTIRDRDSVTRVYLNRMSARVSEEFEAFIMLMDENGNMMIAAERMVIELGNIRRISALEHDLPVWLIRDQENSVSILCRLLF